MKKQLTKVFKFAFILFGIFALASCSMTNKSIQEARSHVRFVHDDFTYSEQVSGEATTVRILGVDWKRLFKKGEHANAESQSTGIDLANLPVIGNVMREKTYNLALYEALKSHPEYDMIIYPQYEMKRKGFIGIYTKTTVKATARLGKLKN